MTLQVNSALLLDGYKTGHKDQYPQGTEFVHSNLTARSAKYSLLPEGIHNNKVVFFGLSYYVQNYIIEHWNKNFFSQDIDVIAKEYTDEMNSYLGPNSIGEEHIRKLHAYGKMPIRIKALLEGTRVPIQVPMTIVENIGKDFFWLTNYLETIWSAISWLPITSATTAHGYRQIIEKYAEETGGSKEFVMFQGHDFSFRGMAGLEAALMSGAAHLTSFYGTDTVPAIQFLKKFYKAGEDGSEVIGVSVPASEHAVMCMGEKDSEIETFKRFITELYPSGIVSIVSDTWDFWKVITEYTAELKDTIMSRDGKMVIRPDSGDPVKIVCGYSWDGKEYSSSSLLASKIENLAGEYEYDVAKINGKFHRFYYVNTELFGPELRYEGEELTENEVKGAIQCLWDVFGGTVNDKGYKTLDPHIGLIYGDSINFQNCEAILKGLKEKGFASDNVVFGFGSFGYQMVTRDTFGMAVKATFGIVNGEPRNIFKDPKTGSGKKSAKGLLAVLKNDKGELYLRQEIPYDEYVKGVDGDQMQVVFEDGVHLVQPTLKDIRKRLWGD